jgi:hypothetical protein
VAWHRKLIDGLTALCGVALIGIPAALLAWFWSSGAVTPTPPWTPGLLAIWGWITCCAIVAVAAAVDQIRQWSHPASPRCQGVQSLAKNHTQELDVRQLVDEPLLARGLPRLLGGLPYNQVVRPWFQEKQLIVPRLAAADDGLKIAHITDLHMSGRIDKRYFEQVFDRVNQWQPDIVAVTGDLVERTRCLDWIPTTLGRLRAQGGVFFVLGNHDLKVDCRALREALTAEGMNDVGSRWCEARVGDRSLYIGGNELPWFGPPADMSDCPPRNVSGGPFRLLLSHSPDQFDWACQREFDLVLAGHCHGGQVRFPLVGAVLAPSLHGTRYVAGVFRRGDTVLHVSRGVSGLAPFRFNCPPEVSLLTLKASDEQATRT